MERRAFVKRVPMAVTGVAAGLSNLTLSACGGVGYLVPDVHPRGVTVPVVLLAERRELFIQSANMERPVFLHLTDEGPVAVHAVCTHRGCQPEPAADRLICPCHGSEFTLAGEVLEGPAERALTRFDVTRDGDRWVIHTAGGSA